MAKKRKTLQEKKRSEVRKGETRIKTSETVPSSTHQVTPTFSYTFTKESQVKSTVHHYSLKHDLYKTLSLSLGIIFFQLILFSLLHNHTLVLPLVSLHY